jgi:hypothetical protein
MEKKKKKVCDFARARNGDLLRPAPQVLGKRDNQLHHETVGETV